MHWPTSSEQKALAPRASGSMTKPSFASPEFTWKSTTNRGPLSKKLSKRLEAGNNKVEDYGPDEVPCQTDGLKNSMRIWHSPSKIWRQTKATATPTICPTLITLPPSWGSHGNDPKTLTSVRPSPSLDSFGTSRRWSPYDRKRRTNICSRSRNGERREHTLVEVQKLYGKLLHATLAHPDGRPYLASLEAMLGIFHNSPHLPRTPPRQVPSDLDWWTTELSKPTIGRSIPTAHGSRHRCFLRCKLKHGYRNHHWNEMESMETPPRMGREPQEHWVG